MPPQLKSRANLYMTLAMGAAALAYVYFVFIPQRQVIAQLQEQITARQQTIMQGAATAAQWEAEESAHRAANDFIAAERARLCGEAQLARVFEEISTHVAESGASTARFEPRPIERFDTLGRRPLSLGVRGDYAALVELTRRIESLPYAHWVSDLRITLARENAQDLLCEINLAVFTEKIDISH